LVLEDSGFKKNRLCHVQLFPNQIYEENRKWLLDLHSQVNQIC